MISERYRQLKEIADSEYNDIIEESEIISTYTGRARKLRLKLVDNTLKPVGLILNFGERKIEVKRKVKELE